MPADNTLVSINIMIVTLFPRPSQPGAPELSKQDTDPVLLGHVNAFTDASGSVNFCGLIVAAAPGAYLLNVSAPDYGQVPLNLLCRDASQCVLQRC